MAHLVSEENVTKNTWRREVGVRRQSGGMNRESDMFQMTFRN